MSISSPDTCISHNNNNLPNLSNKSNGMRGNKYNCNNSGTPRTRLERLLRERELRKFNKSLNDGETELLNNDSFSPDSFEAFSWFNDEESLETISANRNSTDGCERQDSRASRERLLVVANRLPVSAVRRGVDSWHLEISVGGLVSALLGVKEFETRWIGWAGVNVPDEIGQRALIKALAEKRCIPVFLDEEIVHQYYNGYCNNILWPLFHYLGLPQEDRLATTRSFQSQFDAYKKANQMFAEVVKEHYVEGDVVWCHDYHLMFLPKCLKERNRKMKVGWFLHTPFPSSEIHRTLPSRLELLRSVLAADLVGFHTYDYARHFVSACTRILGLEGTPEGVEDQGRLTRVAAFPIGIDSDRFIRALELPQVQDHMKELKERFAGRKGILMQICEQFIELLMVNVNNCKVMLGVDRLDMIKGIPQKILAFEKFLEENPNWRDKVVLLQIAVPTRTDVPEYQKLTSQVHEIVGRINGRFGTLTAVPIHHLDRSLDFHALCALYAVTDVALVTSLRDGMNLVSYEFVACQASKKGVLILRAAQSLGAGAILVNPWNVTEVASSIGYALNMPADEREKRHHHNFVHVTTHTSQEWAATFVSELNDTIVEAQLRTRQIPPPLPIEVAVDRYAKSNNRLLILGFNATLTEPVDTLGRKGSQIKEMEPKLRPDLQEPLRKLCDDPKTTIVVLSGSDRSVLDDNFGDYSMWLAAENGMFLRATKGDWMTTMPENLNMEWVDSVKHVFEYFTERTPRSHFELRETSLIWNYKYADVEFGRLQARDLLQHLWTGPISNASLDVVQGSRSIEVRSVGVTKGAAIDRILGEIVHNKGMKEPIDYVLCIGHFLAKDEDIYTFFEPELPSEVPAPVRSHVTPPVRTSVSKLSTSRSLSREDRLKKHRPMPTIGRSKSYHVNTDVFQSRVVDRMSLQEGSSVLDLQGDNYFSCSVARKRSNARYLLGSSDDVVKLLTELTNSWINGMNTDGSTMEGN
ncbi:Alpha,alpha-trehalose-phosphate synthase [UDP-forming] 1 -like protein [Gossypium arboreum]|uniref:alpha,alpha-trehalose-phosphate synthase (UDP-forming) n=1 Tax=Gossypium arboreum TaxID=29729 RepID=A0A0B0MH36_GOSAR|nr:Alpha,alpha-trehalose-phosphate synthase [UDP-forming] 1 -like protein [Gossypium arboreum]